jgi:uncharacterized protein HemX
MEEARSGEAEARPEDKPKKPFGWKAKLALVLAVILVIAGTLGYFWAQKTYEIRQEAQAQLDKVERYDSLKAGLQAEYSRCQAFISQEEGEFGSFQYCQRFISWVNDNYPDLRP